MMRCRRCERMYDEEQPVDCRYHPGRFGKAHALVPFWTCCGSEEQLGGCRSALEHAPCETTRRAMLSFVLPSQAVGAARSASDFGNAPSEDGLRDDEEDASSARGGQTLVFEMPDESLTTATASAQPGAAEHGGILQLGAANDTRPSRALPPPSRAALARADDSTVDGRYVVMPTDTFRAVALKHGMSVEELAQLNGTRATRCLMPGQVLRVTQPFLSEEDEAARNRRQMVLRFRRQQQCTIEEAKYYCETNDFQWATAVAERQADVAWERDHLGTHEQALQESRAAEREAALLVSELSTAAARGAEQVAWPKWLRPWEDQLVRRCLVGAN